MGLSVRYVLDVSYSKLGLDFIDQVLFLYRQRLNEEKEVFNLIPVPYVGVTGFTRGSDVTRTLEVLPDDFSRRLMVGVLASSKTISGLGNKWPGRYPKTDQLGSIFQCDPRVLNLVHYATDDSSDLYDQLIRVRELTEPYFQGFQLNIPWPDPHVLFRFAIAARRTFIVLQIGNRALEAVNGSPEKLSERLLQDYEGSFDYILLDMSGGYGKALDPVLLGEYLDVLKSLKGEHKIGIAGGLCRDALPSISSLIKNYPDLCIDAEGKLMGENGSLDLNLVKEYLEGMHELLEQTSSR